MHRPFVHSLIAWLCLFSFGLDLALHALGPVVCTSESGTILEWMCEKDEQSNCLRTGAERNPLDQSAQNTVPPCEDRPLGDDHDAGHHQLAHRRQGEQAQLTLPPVTLAVLCSFTFDPVVRGTPTRIDVRVRPPDTVARLRTVIMIV